MSTVNSWQWAPHNDSIPDFTISTPIVSKLPTLLNESRSAVELECCGIVRPRF